MEVLKSELNSTSAYVPADLTKDKLLQRHIDSLTKSNIKIDKIDLPKKKSRDRCEDKTCLCRAPVF